MFTSTYVYLINITAWMNHLKVISYKIHRHISGFVFLHNFTFLDLTVSIIFQIKYKSKLYFHSANMWVFLNSTNN